VTKRRPVQERGEASRDALLHAALELLAERGMAGLSHRAIADRAGVSPGMTSYFFSSLDELGRDAIISHYTARTAELRTVVDAMHDLRASPSVMARAAANLLATNTEQLILAHFEVCLNAARRPDLREALAPMLAILHDVAERVADVIGVEDRVGFGIAAVAIIDGVQLRRLAQGIAGRDEMEEALTMLGVGMIALQEDPDRWRTRLGTVADTS